MLSSYAAYFRRFERFRFDGTAFKALNRFEFDGRCQTEFVEKSAKFRYNYYGYFIRFKQNECNLMNIKWN